MKIVAKSAEYICQATILIIAAESKIITAANRKEIFLKILPRKQKTLTLMKNDEKSPICVLLPMPSRYCIPRSFDALDGLVIQANAVDKNINPGRKLKALAVICLILSSYFFLN
tara:strand:+ start:224 stop:565 length:342 start_codon:yes stop_codon:yes gene_type:complete